MGIPEVRLRGELACMEKLRQQSSFIDFEVSGDLPDEYRVTFTCRGLVDPYTTSELHVALIYLPAEFPRQPPQVSFLTPCFHPNIAALFQMQAVQEKIHNLLRQARNEEEREEIMRRLQEDEKFHTARVCLDTLDLNWSPSITLDLICLELAEMIQYKRYNPDSPLNEEAAFWAEANRGRLPVDSRSVLDLRALEGIRILSEPLDLTEDELVRIL